MTDQADTPSLRQRLADSERLNAWLARRIAGYIRFVYRTSRWQRIGYEELDALVERGETVVVALWHQRVVMTPYFFPLHLGPGGSVTSSARAGSMVGRVQREFGLISVPMTSRAHNVALSRKVLKMLHGGITVGFAVDGPRGPARVATPVPLAWARSAGKRIFVISYSVRNGWEANTWDRTLIPRPWTEGVFLCREWEETVPRKLSEAETERLRQSLEDKMNAVTAEADAMMGRTP
jgi:lysophospholipid acyltransferase (LPLAT)-like uncharacterized protein